MSKEKQDHIVDVTKKVTAVEFLLDNMHYYTSTKWEDIIQQAKEMENKTDIEQLIERNYAAQVRRGQINNKTTFFKFVNKIEDELYELNQSYIDTNKDFDSKELIDIMLVCFSMAKHFAIDWQQVMKDKVEYNEKRKD